jgi:hypothetical protein
MKRSGTLGNIENLGMSPEGQRFFFARRLVRGSAGWNFASALSLMFLNTTDVRDHNHLPEFSCDIMNASFLANSMTTGPSSNGKLRLSPNTAVLVAPGWLYVLNRRGLARVQAEGIDKVHERVATYLNGNHDEEELLRAVKPDQRVILKKYLDAMLQAGAIQTSGVVGEEENDGPSTPQLPQSIGSHDPEMGDFRQLTTEDQRRVLVSLQGNFPATEQGYSTCVLFATPEEMGGHWKAIWRSKRHRPHLISVVMARKPGAKECDEHERLMYAQWLAECGGIESWKERRARIYQLDQGEPKLSLVFEMAATPKSREQLAKAYVVSPTSDAQLPLVAATAALPFWGDSITRYGLDYDRLSQELESELAMRLVLAAEAVNNKVPVLSKTMEAGNSGKRPGRAQADLHEARSWPVAGSWLHVKVRALEQCLSRAGIADSAHYENVNFLQMAGKHAQIDYLIRILRLRLHTMMGRMGKTSAGLYFCEYQQTHAYSVVESKAVRDLLLAAAREIFYGPTTTEQARIGHECDYSSFLPDDELAQVVQLGEKLLGEKKLFRRCLFKRVKRWGFTAWTAHYDQ